jgi:hypothetical protein
VSVPTTIISAALAAGLPNPLTVSLIPKGKIGGISVQATLEEVATDTLQVTEHPVQAGAQITDHAFFRPAELVMRCGWSNAQNALTGITVANSTFSGGSVSLSDYVSAIYSRLIALQQSCLPFTVQSTIRQYTNMLLTSIALTRDQKTSQALMLSATMKQIIVVNTSTATLPAANMAMPASTQATTNVGPQSLTSGQTPNPGGANPPLAWPAGSDEAINNFPVNAANDPY